MPGTCTKQLTLTIPRPPESHRRTETRIYPGIPKGITNLTFVREPLESWIQFWPAYHLCFMALLPHRRTRSPYRGSASISLGNTSTTSNSPGPALRGLGYDPASRAGAAPTPCPGAAAVSQSETSINGFMVSTFLFTGIFPKIIGEVFGLWLVRTCIM